MKKILILMALIVLPIVNAVYIDCFVNENCMIGEFVYDDTYTPINEEICAIDIYKENVLQVSADMTNESNGYHHYDFTANSTGVYNSIMYCDEDGSIFYLDKTLRVKEGGNMIATGAFGIGIILIPLLFGFMLLLSSFFLDEEHTILKLFMFVLSFVTVFSSFYLGSVIAYSVDPLNTALQDAIGNTMRYVGMFYFVLLVYLFIYLTRKFIKSVREEKEDNLKY